MLQETFQELPSCMTFPISFACILLLWRLWAFTIRPWIWPVEPKDVPYWVPFLGHTLKFFKDNVTLMENGLNSTGRTHEPFAIQLLGRKLYICTAPSDVATVFDNTEGFNFDNHLTELLTSFSISRENITRAWHKPEPGDWCYIPDNHINPKQKSLIHCVEDICKQQLLPGDHMDRWSRIFLDSIQTSLQGLHNLRFCADDKIRLGCEGYPPRRRISLYTMISTISVEASAHAMFGSHLHEIDSSVVEHMLAFNEHGWMIVFRSPNIIGLPVDRPRRKLMTIMREFVQLPEEKRPHASWVITSILAGMETVGMDLESKASMVLMIFWAAVSNEHNSCFWLLTHMLYDRDLFSKVKEETEAAWPSGQLDIKYLSANCPNLDATFNEVLRLNNTAAAVRVVTQDTMIGGKILRQGSMVMIPFRQLHTNEDVWGTDASNFDPSRFLKKRSWARHPSFRPFGGGATLCPGQVLAKQEVFGSVAVLLHRFDMSLARDPAGEEMPPFPQLNSMTPSFGINGPLRSMDTIVTITEADSSVQFKTRQGGMQCHGSSIPES